jgi:transcriptional regulator with XRE-family HTH domain
MKPETLKSIRKAEKQSIDNFAKRLGKGRNAMSRYERGLDDIPPYIAYAATCIHHRFEPLD